MKFLASIVLTLVMVSTVGCTTKSKKLILKSSHPLLKPTRDIPPDYGTPEIRIEPTVTFDQDHYYVSAKSNLLEGTQVSLSVEIPDHWSIGYTDKSTVQRRRAIWG